LNCWHESECGIISKSKFFSENIKYLGYWITYQGIQPFRNNVEAILNVNASKTRKDQYVIGFQEEAKEALILLSTSENSIISNIMLTIPVQTVLIFK
jgi:hypothetical protein